MKRLLILLALVALAVMPASAIVGTCALTGGTPVPGHDGPMACDGNVDTWAVSDNGNAGINITFPSQTWVTAATMNNNGKEIQNRSYNLVFALGDSGNTTFTCEAAWGTTCSIALPLGGQATINSSVYIVQQPGLWTNWTEVSVTGYNSTYSDLIPVVDFIGSPLSGVAPLTVSFTDNSTNEVPGSTTYNWTITPSTNVTGYTGSTENHIAVFNSVGLYTVSHGVSTPYGSGISVKSNYINVTNQTAYVTTAFRATDGVTGNRITGATIHLQDVENGSWSNSSTNLGVATITVLVGHHISAYATALGFEDGEYLNAPAMAWTYDIMMLPTGFANVSAGNVTAYITVTDADTLQKLYSCQVNAVYSNAEGSVIIEGTTSSAGVASFVLPNNTNVHFNAIKSGYGGAQLVLNTGTGSGGDAHVKGEIKLSKLSVTPTITATTLPGGGTPVPTLTYLENCNPSASDYDAAKCRASHGNSGLNILAENLDILVWICIMVTIMYLLGIRLGG